MSDDGRHFENRYEDYRSHQPSLLDPNGGLTAKADLIERTSGLIQFWFRQIDKDATSDPSIYTGLSGYGLLLYHLDGTGWPEPKRGLNLERSEQFINVALKRLRTKQKDITFLCGDTGPLVVGALLAHRRQKVQEARSLVGRVLDLLPAVQTSTDDEMLYGRCGYLYGLLLLRRDIDWAYTMVTDQHIRQVIDWILESGRKTAAELKQRHHQHQNLPPLFFFWHDSPYIGAAHGFAGILYQLLGCRRLLTASELDQLVRPTVDWLVSIRFAGGNWPSSFEKERDRLVHWCHGAPGLVGLMSRAWQVFDDRSYLEAALKGGDVIWSRGLLHKGFGLCHGVGGNGYAFLDLYRATDDQRWLHRAWQFAQFCLDYEKNCGHCRQPDRPWSLFEGLAGTIYFLSDLVRPDQAQFPAYEISLSPEKP